MTHCIVFMQKQQNDKYQSDKILEILNHSLSLAICFLSWMIVSLCHLSLNWEVQ